MSYYVYILKCGDGTLYTGQTNDLAKRLKLHSQGKGAKYTRGRGPFEIVYTEEFATVNEALSKEAELKKLSRKKKLALIKTNGMVLSHTF